MKFVGLILANEEKTSKLPSIQYAWFHSGGKRTEAGACLATTPVKTFIYLFIIKIIKYNNVIIYVIPVHKYLTSSHVNEHLDETLASNNGSILEFK